MQKQRTRRSAGFHSLRHYFCSTCANQGIPAAVLEKMTGDNAATLNKYYIRGEIDAAAVAQALARAEIENDPDRECLHELADTLPIESVRLNSC